MKRKLSILIALVLAISLLLVPVAVSAGPGPIFGVWQPYGPSSGTVEVSTDQYYSSPTSVHLEAFVASSPSDSNEVYVMPTGVTTLNDLNDVTFWLYCPAGLNDVAPCIDVWLDLDGTYSTTIPCSGDEEWLLGMLTDVTVFDAWVAVAAADITWVRAMGGTVYGVGATGLGNAKAETVTTNVIYTGTPVYATLGDCPVLGVGVLTGGPGTYISARLYDMDFYVDDLTINTITYDLEATSGVGLTAEIPSIVAISVTPTSIDFGTITPGTPVSGGTITVGNIGTVTVNVSALIDPAGGAFQYLKLNGEQRTGGSWSAGALAMGALAPTVTGTCTTMLDVPVTYSAQGPESTTLIFIGTP